MLIINFIFSVVLSLMSSSLKNIAFAKSKIKFSLLWMASTVQIIWADIFLMWILIFLIAYPQWFQDYCNFHFLVELFRLLYGTPHFIVVCFIVLCRYCGFLFQTEGLSQPCLKQVYWLHFSNSIFLLCISVSHFGNSCTISNIFIIIICVMMICD